MNEVLQALILGIVQGLTELLPISSSGHLNLIPWIFNWNIPESFDVALHFGTLLAIVIFFFKDWLKLIEGGYKQVVKKEKSFEAIGFLLDHFVGVSLGKMPLLIATTLIVMGIILYFVDKKAAAKTDYEHMTFKQTFLIGFSQAMAFIPGVSRSGVTMTTGRLMGVDRESTAKYSFLLSTPIVLGATLYKFKDFVLNIPFFVGVLASFIVGIIVIKFLLEYLKKGSFKVFAIYRVILGLFIIGLYIVR